MQALPASRYMLLEAQRLLAIESPGSPSPELSPIPHSQTVGIPTHLHYTVYGQRLCSNAPFFQLYPSAFEQRDIEFRWDEVASVRNYTGPNGEHTTRLTTNMNADLVIFREDGDYHLLWERLCEFAIAEDGTKIASRSRSEVAVDGLLLGTAMPFALHLKGINNIHAGAVVTPAGAIALMAAPGSGKSTLTAELAAAGYPFLTDDILAISAGPDGFVAHPGFPYVSLAARSIEAIFGAARVPGTLDPDPAMDQKARFKVDGTWATFSAASAPLKGLFVVDRHQSRDGEPSLEKLTVPMAIRALVENTISVQFLPKPALERHLKFASKVATTLPVWRLSFPSGFSNSKSVIATILRAVA